jgi:outer membrane protein
MRLIQRLFLALPLLTPWQAFAQEDFSFKQCLAYAKAHHLNVKLAENEIVKSREQVAEGIASYLPQVNGSVGFDDNLKRPTTIIPAGTFGPNETRIQFGNQYSTNAVVQLDQVVYDQTILTGLKANKPYIEMAELRKAKTEEDIAYNTAVSYYQVLVLQEQRRLLELNLEKFARIEKIVRLQTEKGVARKVDYERVQVGLSNLQAQIDMLKNNEALVLNRLKLNMGMQMEQEIQLSDKLDAAEIKEMPSLADFDGSGLLDVQIMDKNLSLQEIELRRKQHSRLPTVSAYGRYGAQAFGNEFGQSFDTWFAYSTIGLKLNVPIFAGLRRERVINQAEISVQNTRYQMELNAQSLQLRNENAKISLLNAFTSMGNTTANLDLAESVMQTTELEYNKGVGTLSDFLNAEYALKEAQSNYVRALLNFMSARLDYELSKGTLETYLQSL